MAVRFGLMRRRISTFRTKSSFSMYKWHVSTYTSYIISQRCIFFNRQDFVSDVKNEKFMIFLNPFAIFSHDCTTKWRFVLVRCADVYQLFAQNLASPCTNDMSQLIHHTLYHIHTLRVHYAHAAANLNSGYSKYAKVARVHYFCTIALRISRAVLTRAWVSRRVDLRERRVDFIF